MSKHLLVATLLVTPFAAGHVVFIWPAVLTSWAMALVFVGRRVGDLLAPVVSTVAVIAYFCCKGQRILAWVSKGWSCCW